MLAHLDVLRVEHLTLVPWLVRLLRLLAPSHTPLLTPNTLLRLPDCLASLVIPPRLCVGHPVARRASVLTTHGNVLGQSRILNLVGSPPRLWLLRMAQIRFVEVRHRARRFPVPALSAAVALAGCWLKEDEQRFELEHQIENSVSPGNVVGERMLVDVAVGQSFMLLQLLSHEDKLLLGTRRALFCLDLLFHFLDGVRALNLDGDCLDLEVAWTPEFPMPRSPAVEATAGAGFVSGLQSRHSVWPAMCHCCARLGCQVVCGASQSC
mmetsp:Transcript_12492/g.29527  ORF Transcript_12492/g.29527 Transcript_12492/m.29527 type:complete len:266 (-) Transcript_12492:874-1671(-)